MRLTNKHRRERLRRRFKAGRAAWRDARLTYLHGAGYTFTTLWLWETYSGEPSPYYERPAKLKHKGARGDLVTRASAAQPWLDREKEHDPDAPA